MKYIVGTKENMTQIFTEEGEAVPVTIVNADPNVITQVKTLEKDGYDAIQVGFGSRKDKNIKKPQLGHFKDLGKFFGTKENRVSEEEMGELKAGDEINLESFEEGEKVKITAISKGKGFQGVIKRHGFKGGRRSHGQKHSEREPGSIGATGPQRVFKGTRMGGRMGADKVTVKNLTVAKILKDDNKILIKGAIPGRRGSVVEILGEGASDSKEDKK